MESKIKYGSIIISLGAVWGLLEATLGYLLQFLPPFFSGLIMFPIAASILTFAYLKTHRYSSLLWIGVIAASIKSINLFFPMNHWRTINPMVAILLETLMLMVLVKVIVNKPLKYKTLAFVGASIGWRSLYLLYMGGQFIATGFVYEAFTNFTVFVNFIAIQAVLGAVFALILYYGAQSLSKKSVTELTFKPQVAFMMLVLAVLTTIYL